MSEIQRFFLYMLLFFIGMILWTEWNKEQDLSIEPNRVSHAQDVFPAASNSISPIVTKTDVKNEEKTALPEFKKSSTPTTTNIKNEVPSDRIFTMSNNVVSLKIDKLGGSIVEVSLNKYQQSDEIKTPYQLFNTRPQSLYYAQSSINGVDFGKDKMPMFSLVSMTDTKDSKIIKLIWQNEQGLQLHRIYTLDKDSYLLDIENIVQNNGTTAWDGRFFYQLVRKDIEIPSAVMGMSSYLGASISDPGRKLYEKVAFDDMQKNNLDRQVKGGWVAMQEHYFLTAFIPDVDSTSDFFSRDYANGLFAIGIVSAQQHLSPGDSHRNHINLYMGPELIENLDAVAPGLSMTVDYGILAPISSFLFWLMKAMYEYVGNWGWAIILVTLLIKLVFYKLSASSYRSMANMKKFQPMMEELKQRYADDKQKLSQATMALYKKEKINPLGGCLPILIQLPVFIGLYWVLLESVELRQAPFIWWIHDLATKDPYYILPIVMGGSWFVQQKLTPAPADPIQAKVMLMMPLVFTIMFLNMPSGLVLYWLINNVLSIIQQWYISRAYGEKPAKEIKTVS